MRKLNNSGFAISTLLYSILIIGALVISLLYSTVAFRKKSDSDFVNSIEDNMNTENTVSNVCKTSTNLSRSCAVSCGTENFHVVKIDGNNVYLLADNYLVDYTSAVYQYHLGVSGTPISTVFSYSYHSNEINSYINNPDVPGVEYWRVEYPEVDPETGEEVIDLKPEFGLNYPVDVYNSTSPIFNYLEKYKIYLTNVIGLTNVNLTLIDRSTIMSNSFVNGEPTIKFNYSFLSTNTPWFTAVSGADGNIYCVNSSSGFIKKSGMKDKAYIRPILIVNKTSISTNVH